MENGELFRLRLDTEMESKLLEYIKSRRYKLMLMLYISLALSLLLAPIAILQMNGHFTWLALDSGAIGDSTMLLLSLRGVRRIRLCYIWYAALADFAVTFFGGIGRKFGPGSDYHCVVKQKYQYGYVAMEGKNPDIGKFPYRVYDTQGYEYDCPVFIDYKKAEKGSEMFCVILDNGSRFAFQKKDLTPWWERD